MQARPFWTPARRIRADLYDPDFMPQDLRKAHESLDKVVDVAFGAAKPCKSNDERLQILFDRYAEMTQEQ